MPRAEDMPPVQTVDHPVPCRTNPLGVKGVGEAGTTGALAAIMNAIADAIPNGAGADMQMPATPEKVWRACQAARQAGREEMTGTEFDIVGTGPDLLLLHSLLSDRSSFAALTERLSGQRRLIIPSLPGFGASAPAEPLDGYTDRMAELLRHLGSASPTDVLGNGLGSFVALKLAACHSDLVGRLTLLGAGIAFPESGRQTFRTLADKVEREGMPAVADAAMARMFPEDFATFHPDIIADRNAVFLGIDPVTFAAAARSLAALDLSGELDRIRQKVLIVAGEKDGATPPALGRALAARLHNADFIKLPDIGHAPHIQAPDELVAIIAPFLGLR